MKIKIIVALFILAMIGIAFVDHYSPDWYVPADKPCDRTDMLMITC
jgi:hypothetical protein